jgi:tetratricopeptide (TPR) repeat protein
MNILAMNDLSDQSSTGLNGTFLHYQLLMNVLHRMPSSNPSLDKYELVDYCQRAYEGNEIELKIIKEFEQTYCRERALWWYSRESMFYRLLNKALRVQNIELLFIMRFFVRDIYHELVELQQEQTTTGVPSIHRVYRGQLMSSEEHDLLCNSVGNLVSMNSFLSTSTDRELTLFLVESLTVPGSTLKAVLFEIDICPGVDPLRPFADISVKSHIPTESEILFALGTIFRLESIRDENNVCMIHLITGSNLEEENITKLLKWMREEIGKENDLLTLGDILCKSGKFDEAKRFYHRLLHEIPADDPNVPYCFQSLGDLANEHGEYDDAIIEHKKALDNWSQTLAHDHPSVAVSYNSLGIAYDRQGKKNLALEAYNKALSMFRQMLGDDNEHVAACLANLASFYEEQQMDERALEYHRDALKIQEKILPANHQQLGTSYHNIAIVHARLQQFDIALSHCKRGLEMRLASFPADHWRVAASYEGLGCIYAEMDNHDQSLAYLQKALTIYQKHFPIYHPDVRRTKISIQTVKGHK